MPLRFHRTALGATMMAAALSLAAPAAGETLEGFAGAYLAAEQASRRGDIGAAADFYASALARDPENAEIMERAILYQVASGRVETALALARRLESLRPGHHLGVLLLAADGLKKGEAAEVRTLLQTEDGNGGPFVGILIEAWAAYAEGDLAGARDALVKLEQDKIGGAAGELMAVYHLGLVEAAAGNDEAAEEAFTRAASKAGTGTLRLARVRAGALARTGKIDEARAVLSDRLDRTLGDKRLETLDLDLSNGRLPGPVVQTGEQGAAEALFGVAGFLSRGQNRNIGLAYARLATYLHPDLIDAKLLIAEMLRADEQFELATAAYESIPRDAPEALEAQIGRAEAMQLAGNVQPAIVAMRETAARYPRSVEAQTALGDMLRRESRFAEAAAAYDAAISLIETLENRHWVLLYQRGICYERAKEWDKAETDFFAALELEPDQPLVLNYLGYSWVEMGKNLPEAQKMIEKAVDQRPEDGYIVDSLGWVLYRVGDFEGAAEHLERAVELRPVDPVINDHFGDALWMVGRRTEARFQWKRALSFEPEEEDASRIRRKLEVGLDAVLEEEAKGQPAIVGADGSDKNGG